MSVSFGETFGGSDGSATGAGGLNGSGASASTGTGTGTSAVVSRIPVSVDALEVGAKVAREIPWWSADASEGMIEPALWWAENVGGVFPLTPANSRGPNPGKIPMKDLGSGGQWERASRDFNEIVSWWRVSPWSNVGLVTQANGILIVDVDPRAGGDRSLMDWCRENGVQLSDVPRDTSPSGDGGVHLWWRLPPGMTRYKSGPFLDGVDVSWQVPVAPSLRRVQVGEKLNRTPIWDYRPYAWTAGDPRALPLAPDALLEGVVNFVGRKRTSGERRRRRPIGSDPEIGELPDTKWFHDHGFRPHRRNIDCYALACRLWRAHWPHRELVMEGVYRAWCETPQHPTPFPWEEAASRVEWAYQFIAPGMQEAMKCYRGIRF